MATAATKPEVPTFSYAQAAKGLAVSNTTQPPVKNTEQAPKAIDGVEVSKVSVSEQTSNSASVEVSRESDKPDSLVDPEAKSTTTGSSKNAVSGTSSPNFGTASTSTLAKDDEIPALTNGVSDSQWDKQSQTSTLADKSTNGKDNKKDDSAKPTDKNPPKELKVAPPPAVNVWKQRIEALEAKAKAGAAGPKSANTTSTTTKTSPPKQAPSTSDLADSAKAPNKKKTANETQADASGSLSKDRKRTENGRTRDEGVKKSNNRVPRPNEESAEVAPPPVADATAWPTPQTALGEDKRKAQDKGDKSEKFEKSSSIRGKEKWTPVHYVPTAVFNTPLPSGARRGGRPSRGGREGGRGGAHSANSTNSNSNASGASGDTKPPTSQPSQVPPKPHANLTERGRNESGLSRANSLPNQARKTNTADANAPPEQRRFPHGSDRSRIDSRPPKVNEESQAPQNGTVDASNSKSHRESRTAKVAEFTPAHKLSDHSLRSGTSPTDAQGNGRPVVGHERRFDGAPRDTNGYAPRDREFREFNRERGDYQRDRDHPKDRNDSRPERGRGGYRGRGGHSYGAGSHNQHYQNSQMSQNSFVSKSFSAGDRQRSQQQNFQNGTQPQHASHRLSLRSPSMPNSAGMYSNYPVPEINTVYPNYQHVPQGPMSAVPYQPYMESFSLMGLLQLQLEYYFSVDNLCKDLYLRKHMDSQGFVRLSFIAGFKRIKNLTEEYELLRHSSRQLRNAECIIGDDGQDCLRPRDKWEQWVLPIDQRDPSAQNEGHVTAQFHPVEDNMSVPVNGTVSNGFHPISNGLPNGFYEHTDSRTTLSSAAPEFTPYVAVGAQADIANVGDS